MGLTDATKFRGKKETSHGIYGNDWLFNARRHWAIRGRFSVDRMPTILPSGTAITGRWFRGIHCLAFRIRVCHRVGRLSDGTQALSILTLGPVTIFFRSRKQVLWRGPMPYQCRGIRAPIS